MYPFTLRQVFHRSIFSAAVVCSAAYTNPAHSLAFEPAWQVTGQGGFSAPNALHEVAGKTAAIVVCEKGTGVVCFDTAGKPLWRHAMTPPLMVAPAVADVDGDGNEDVVAADSVGHVAALRGGDGTVLWSVALASGTAASMPTIADLDGNGRPEVLVGDRSGTLSCLDSTGTLRWSFSGDGETMGPVLVADVYDSPGKEVFLPSHDRCLYALTARGEWLWDLYFPADLFPNSTPVLADVDGNNVPELYLGGGLHHFYRIDLAQPRPVFEENVYMHINNTLAAADLDRDGKDEVVFGTKAGAVYLYGKEGIRWVQSRPNTSFQSSPVLLAADEQGTLTTILFGIGGNAFAYDAQGNELARAEGLGCAPEMSGLLAGDLDNDGQAELIATSAAEPEGKAGLFCFKLGIPYHEDNRNRLVLGQDRAHSGMPPHFTPYPLLPAPRKESGGGVKPSFAPVGQPILLSGVNTWRYDVENPEQQRLAMQLAIQAPGGSVCRFIRHIRDTKNRAIFRFPVVLPGEYQITRALMDADARNELRSESQNMPYAGLDSDTHYAQGLFSNIESIAAEWRKTNAPCAEDLLQLSEALQGRLLRLSTDGTPDRPAKFATLREDTERLLALGKAGQALAPDASFAAWKSCPWAYFEPRATLPAPEKQTASLALALCREEYGTLALNLTNFTARTLDVRAICDGVERKGEPGKAIPGKFVSFRRAVMVPTQNRERVADALPELDTANTLSLPPTETQQLWITLTTSGLEPGEYVANLRIKSVAADPSEQRIPITVTVHDLAPPRPRPLHLCNWVSHSGELSSKDDAAFADLVAHGESVFLAPAPTAKCEATGEIVGELNFAEHDTVVKRLSPQGFLLFLSPQGGLQGQAFLSEPWRKAFVLYLRNWAKHLRELGVADDRWALYPYDEPSAPYGETTRNLIEVAKLIREADPAIQIYTDPTSGFTMECAEQFKGLIDIWQPSDELIERLGTEFLPVAHRTAKQVWFYEAAGNSKTLSCLGKYLWRFWYAFAEDFTGVGWWVYAIHGPDRWDGPNPINDYWATVYDGPNGPVTSKRWEVTREGVQDYERLFALRAELRAAEARGLAGPPVEAARKLLADLPAKMERVLLQTGRRLPLTVDSVPAYEETTRLVEEARAQVTAARLQLKALTK